MDARIFEGFEDELKEILNAMPLERRFLGVPPEQRLVGLDRDHQALALPLEVLRALSDDYLRSLSPEIQAELRRRLAGGNA
ncbi:MAG: hypothetical protein ABJE95_39295 [Byssovorax sp.]